MDKNLQMANNFLGHKVEDWMPQEPWQGPPLPEFLNIYRGKPGPASNHILLPDLKKDTKNKAGWKKHLDRWKAEGIDILKDVADPIPDEYELTAAEELATLDVDAMSDAEAKQKLRELQNSGGTGVDRW
ncbi:hypothetical protein ES708_05912 [subsurface metagenome]